MIQWILDRRGQRTRDYSQQWRSGGGGGWGMALDPSLARLALAHKPGPSAWTCSAGQGQRWTVAGHDGRGGCWERGRGQRAMRSPEVGNSVPDGSGWFDGSRGAIRVLCVVEENGGVARILREREKADLGLVCAVLLRATQLTSSGRRLSVERPRLSTVLGSCSAPPPPGLGCP